ncbi:hypothetical protein [Elizabethkingia anophelis]|uniref:Uncharacterized protein n=2 Tax=Elizabethkingia anophelis TaxID=1117645 RepID=A0A1T3DA43_9FLAO|nr:hypothetical protein [Elizabethkingia anophelis]AMR41270.1 hypothetical protein A2T74_07800 [Elizabethkingia anophelis]AMX47911.1 hypothetical protein A4C56_07800 [Elizabethkingia anophelis]AMX51367.1 hypothetical protein A2T72_07800 [Elizabethkingia anophelis]AMX54762.1 hypothetical protein A2T59_07800 [Elizabethkingia anophelis]AQW91685.1 hypothetical protein BBD28_13985 [Elizabethkingia anophelis]
MKKEMNNNKATQKKRAYLAPTLEVTIIEMEQGIAAGSASVRPSDQFNNRAKEEWNDEDQSGVIDW